MRTRIHARLTGQRAAVGSRREGTLRKDRGNFKLAWSSTRGHRPGNRRQDSRGGILETEGATSLMKQPTEYMKDVANALKEPYLVEGTAIESHLGHGAHADERVAKTLVNVAKALPDKLIQLEHDRRFRFGKETDRKSVV